MSSCAPEAWGAYWGCSPRPPSWPRSSPPRSLYRPRSLVYGMDDLRTLGLPLRLYADEVNLPDTIRDQCFIGKVPETLKWLLYGTPRQHVQAATVSESDLLVEDRAVMARTWVPLTWALRSVFHSYPINTPHSLSTSKTTITFLLFITLYFSYILTWSSEWSQRRSPAIHFGQANSPHFTWERTDSGQLYYPPEITFSGGRNVNPWKMTHVKVYLLFVICN